MADDLSDGIPVSSKPLESTDEDLEIPWLEEEEDNHSSSQTDSGKNYSPFNILHTLLEF